MSNGKAIIWLIRKRYFYVKINYFPESFTNKTKIEVKSDVPNYAKKSDLNSSAGVNISRFAKKKDDLASLKSKVDKLDINKLEKVSSCLKNLKGKIDKLDVDKLLPDPVEI